MSSKSDNISIPLSHFSFVSNNIPTIRTICHFKNLFVCFPDGLAGSSLIAGVEGKIKFGSE